MTPEGLGETDLTLDRYILMCLAEASGWRWMPDDLKHMPQRLFSEIVTFATLRKRTENRSPFKPYDLTSDIATILGGDE